MKSSSVNVWSNLKFLRTAAKNLEACKRKRDKNKGEADGKANVKLVAPLLLNNPFTSYLQFRSYFLYLLHILLLSAHS